MNDYILFTDETRVPKWNDTWKLKDKKLVPKGIQDGFTLEYDWLDDCKIYRITSFITELNSLKNIV